MPVITEMLPRRRQTWVEIRAAGCEPVKLPAEHVPASLVAGVDVSDAEWHFLTVLAEYFALRERALRILARREHFRRELEVKLGRSTRDRDLVQRVVADCQKLGYLDDERAAEVTVRNLLARGGIGRMRLKHELYKRGCPAELIARSLEEGTAALDETTEIIALLKSRRRSLTARLSRARTKLSAKHSGPQLTRELKRHLQASVQALLAGRGFRGEEARRASADFIAELLAESGD